MVSHSLLIFLYCKHTGTPSSLCWLHRLLPSPSPPSFIVTAVLATNPIHCSRCVVHTHSHFPYQLNSCHHASTNKCNWSRWEPTQKLHNSHSCHNFLLTSLLFLFLHDVISQQWKPQFFLHDAISQPQQLHFQNERFKSHRLCSSAEETKTWTHQLLSTTNGQKNPVLMRKPSTRLTVSFVYLMLWIQRIQWTSRVCIIDGSKPIRWHLRHGKN